MSNETFIVVDENNNFIGNCSLEQLSGFAGCGFVQPVDINDCPLPWTYPEEEKWTDRVICYGHITEEGEVVFSGGSDIVICENCRNGISMKEEGISLYAKPVALPVILFLASIATKQNKTSPTYWEGYLESQ